MTRSEFVRLLVLNSICDDFENVDQVILRDVAEIGAKCGLTIERAEVVDALASLVSDGLAKAYFGVRRRRHRSWDQAWPLDDDGNVKEGWQLAG